MLTMVVQLAEISMVLKQGFQLLRVRHGLNTFLQNRGNITEQECSLSQKENR
jgi:hypothetical protein